MGPVVIIFDFLKTERGLAVSPEKPFEVVAAMGAFIATPTYACQFLPFSSLCAHLAPPTKGSEGCMFDQIV